MSKLQLHSSNSDVVIEFYDVKGDFFWVAVRSHDHSATRQVYEYSDHAGIARLFGEAAEHWMGWKGAKVWESLEGELRIELTTDLLGHVTLAARIRSNPGGSDLWQLEAELGLDAGQLDGVAREANRLWCCGG